MTGRQRACLVVTKLVLPKQQRPELVVIELLGVAEPPLHVGRDRLIGGVGEGPAHDLPPKAVMPRVARAVSQAPGAVKRQPQHFAAPYPLVTLAEGPLAKEAPEGRAPRRRAS